MFTCSEKRVLIAALPYTHTASYRAGGIHAKETICQGAQKDSHLAVRFKLQCHGLWTQPYH